MFGIIFKGVLLFVMGMALINGRLRVRALARTGGGSYRQALEQHGIMAEKDARRLTGGVIRSMVVMIRVICVLIVPRSPLPAPMQ